MIIGTTVRNELDEKINQLNANIAFLAQHINGNTNNQSGDIAAQLAALQREVNNLKTTSGKADFLYMFVPVEMSLHPNSGTAPHSTSTFTHYLCLQALSAINDPSIGVNNYTWDITHHYFNSSTPPSRNSIKGPSACEALSAIGWMFVDATVGVTTITTKLTVTPTGQSPVSKTLEIPVPLNTYNVGGITTSG